MKTKGNFNFFQMQIVGRGVAPRLSHKEDLHYTNAVLHESMRISCVVYNALNHVANADVQAGDYVIPKGAVIIPSIMNVMLDSKYFEHPTGHGFVVTIAHLTDPTL